MCLEFCWIPNARLINRLHSVHFQKAQRMEKTLPVFPDASPLRQRNRDASNRDPLEVRVQISFDPAPADEEWLSRLRIFG
jgi:hypothetical protein